MIHTTEEEGLGDQYAITGHVIGQPGTSGKPRHPLAQSCVKGGPQHLERIIEEPAHQASASVHVLMLTDPVTFKAHEAAHFDILIVVPYFARS